MKTQTLQTQMSIQLLREERNGTFYFNFFSDASPHLKNEQRELFTGNVLPKKDNNKVSLQCKVAALGLNSKILIKFFKFPLKESIWFQQHKQKCIALLKVCLCLFFPAFLFLIIY